MQGINAWNVDLLVWESFCLEVYWKYQTNTRNGCQVELCCLSLASSQLHCLLLREMIEWGTADTRELGLYKYSERIKCIQSLNNSSMYVFDLWYMYLILVMCPLCNALRQESSHRKSAKNAKVPTSIKSYSHPPAY